MSKWFAHGKRKDEEEEDITSEEEEITDEEEEEEDVSEEEEEETTDDEEEEEKPVEAPKQKSRFEVGIEEDSSDDGSETRVVKSQLEKRLEELKKIVTKIEEDTKSNNWKEVPDGMYLVFCKLIFHRFSILVKIDR